MLKLLLVENRSHPFAVVRATELRRWVDSGDYTAILAGDYPRREDDDEAKVSDAAAEAAAQQLHRRRSSRARTRSASWSTTSPAVLGSVKLWLDEQLRRSDDD